MNNTLIIGGGFMGHSLALALKAANKDSAISVVEVIQEYRVLLEKSNIYDVVYNKIDQVNSKFHQVIICTTPETTSQILDLILKLFCHSQLITDISSSKSFLNGKNFLLILFLLILFVEVKKRDLWNQELIYSISSLVF